MEIGRRSDWTIDPGTLDWLLKLRWVAVAGQILAIAIAVHYYRLPLDLIGLGGAILVAAASNLLVLMIRNQIARYARLTTILLLGLDTILLTAMLLLSGGLHNPFTSFFLLHVTLATVLLSRAQAAALTGLCFVCVMVIYRFPNSDPHAHHFISMDMHFTGMMVTLFATGLCILLFVGRLQEKLRARDQLLRENRETLDRQRRVVGLATLAAGVAHELATPLSTIAVASHELRLTAGQFCRNEACLSDSTLIRQEVDRCRAIIDRLSSSGEEARRKVMVVDSESLVKALEGFLPKGCLERLKVECARELSLQVDTVAFLQSLAAVIKNGCEADESGAPVLLKVESVPGRIVFSVVDHGPGIPPEVRKRLGEPFVTTKDPGKGIGLGLYLVHMFCYLHDARIQFDSNTFPAGTRVTLDLPVVTI